MSGWYIAVVSGALCSSLVPSGLKAFQFVFESHLFWSGQAQSGVLEFQTLLAGLNFQDAFQGVGPDSITFWQQGGSINEQSIYEHRRWQRVVWNLPRVNNREALDCGEPQAPVVRAQA